MLLAMLALGNDTVLDSEVLADRLWAGSPPATWRSVLRTYVTHLRRLFPDGDVRIEHVQGGYRLRLAPDELDLRRFDAAIDAGRASGGRVGDPDILERALAMWRGQPLVDLADDERAATEAARLEARRAEALEALADARLERGEHERLIPVLEAAVRENALGESLVGRLMVALYRAGRQGEALAAFHRLRRTLAEELGLDPSPELRRLEQSILEQDPALDPPRRDRGTLPAALTPLVGRDQELQAISAVLDGTRLLTITGPGGCGKTRLAVEVARTAGGDAATFVDLARLHAPAQVAPAVLDAFDVRQVPDEDAHVTIARALGGRRVIVVLDNCEHVLDAAATLAARLLAVASDSVILATSRSALGVAGERVWQLDPLAVPPPGATAQEVGAAPAARLLADRVADARGGRTLLAREWPAVATLCRRLDGLPLALELVAARAAVLSLEDLADAVGAHVFTAVAASAGPEHHRSVEACVLWSVDLLTDEQQTALRRASLLPGWFSSEAAAAAVGSTTDVTCAWLADLARQSLLQVSTVGRTRFRVPETVAEIVGRDVEPDEREESLDALARWAAARAESVEPLLRGADGIRLLDELDAERAVLDLALEHGLGQADPTNALRVVAAISPLWAYRGHLVDGRRWLDRALSVAAGADAALQVRLLIASGSHRPTFGDVEGFHRDVSAALALARDAVDGADLVRALAWAGRGALLRGDRHSADVLYREALAAAEGSGDQSAAGSALSGLGDVAAAQDDLEAALALHLRGLAMFRLAGDAHGEGQALLNLGDVARRRDRRDEAATWLGEARRCFDALGDRSCTAATIEALARVAAEAGQPEIAERHYRDAITIRVDLHQDRLASDTRVALGVLLADSGRDLEGAELFGAAGDMEHPVVDRLRQRLGDAAFGDAWSRGAKPQHR